jgi:hypothetical protein
MNASSVLGSIAVAMGFASLVVAAEPPCASCMSPNVQHVCVDDDAQPSWIFRRSNYTHDPETGARVAQYQRLPVIEPLQDERMVTSRYHRTRTNLRGTGGSVETYYDVQSWGNGRGGIDAEWERFHDAWKESYLQGSFYNQGFGFGNGFSPHGFNGFGAPGFGFGFPGIGNGGWGHQGPWKGNNGDGHHGHHGDDNGHHDW